MPARAGLIGALCVTTLCAGCASSSRTDDDYRHKVANTAKALSGVLGSIEVSLRVVHRAPAAYLSVTFAEADDDASSTASNFDAIQPPSAAADRLRDQLDDVMSRTTSMLDDLRIAARRNRGAELATLSRPLHGLQLELSKLQDVAK